MAGASTSAIQTDTPRAILQRSSSLPSRPWPPSMESSPTAPRRVALPATAITAALPRATAPVPPAAPRVETEQLHENLAAAVDLVNAGFQALRHGAQEVAAGAYERVRHSVRAVGYLNENMWGPLRRVGLLEGWPQAPLYVEGLPHHTPSQQVAMGVGMVTTGIVLTYQILNWRIQVPIDAETQALLNERPNFRAAYLPILAAQGCRVDIPHHVSCLEVPWYAWVMMPPAVYAAQQLVGAGFDQIFRAIEQGLGVQRAIDERPNPLPRNNRPHAHQD